MIPLNAPLYLVMQVYGPETTVPIKGYLHEQDAIDACDRHNESRGAYEGSRYVSISEIQL
jgi:hypothetical protein